MAIIVPFEPTILVSVEFFENPKIAILKPFVVRPKEENQEILCVALSKALNLYLLLKFVALSITVHFSNHY